MNQQLTRENVLKWTVEEEEQLMNEIYNHVDINQISIIHNRPVSKIRTRIQILAHRMYMNFVPFYEIMNRTGLNENEILNAVRYVDFRKTQVKLRTTTPPKPQKKIKENSKNQISQLKSELDQMSVDIKKSHDLMSFILGYISNDLINSNNLNTENDETREFF